MAGTIRITPEELEQSSTIFSTNHDNTQQMLSTLNNEVNRLTQSWEGMGQSAFFQQYESLKPQMLKFEELLGTISVQLKQVANTMRDTDQAIAQQLR